MNACAHCQHAFRYAAALATDETLCARRLKADGTNPVDGSPRWKGATPPCHRERASWLPWRCGRSGRFFTDKNAPIEGDPQGTSTETSS